MNLTARQSRRLSARWRRAERRVRDLDEAVARLGTWRDEWQTRREIARAVSGHGPILVGPWLSEVGYEVLYWVPFLRWVQAEHRVDPARFVIVTRGGASLWYEGLGTRRVEIFEQMTPDAFAAGNARRSAQGRGTVKQFDVEAMDEEVLARARRQADVPDASVLHPSLMYRLFQQFWLGHRAPGMLERHTRYQCLSGAAGRLADGSLAGLPELPSGYVAVKFYTAASLPPTEEGHALVNTLVRALAARWPVVTLDTGFALDDHADYGVADAGRIVSLRGHLRPADNLAVQTAVIARARAFVGTCGSLAWLAPLLGVETTAVYTDARFLHGHLQVARRAYQAAGAARFSPLDLSALGPLGLTLAASPGLPAGTGTSS